MFVFARHQNKRVVTAVGRHLLALIIVAIAIANVITVCGSTLGYPCSYAAIF